MDLGVLSLDSWSDCESVFHSNSILMQDEAECAVHILICARSRGGVAQ